MNLKTAIEHVLLATGGNPSTAIATENERIAQIINDTGNYFYSMPWKWREVHDYQIGPAGSGWTALPDDFSEIISIVGNGSSYNVQLTTPEFISSLVGSGQTDSAVEYVAVVYTNEHAGAMGTDGSKAPKVYLRVFPEDISTDADRYLMSYRKGFRLADAKSETGAVVGSIITDALVSSGVAEGSNTDNTAAVSEFQFPYYLDPLFVQYLRAFALGYEQGQLSEQLLAIEAGPLYQRAISRDGMVQQTFGRMSLAVPPTFPVNAQSTVANPS